MNKLLILPSLVLGFVTVLRLHGDDSVELQPWQISDAPALPLGELGDWDDFQISSPCVLRVDNQWQMYYAGARLNEDGYSAGIGLATSRDGVKWKKQSLDWPIVAPEGYPDAGTSAKEIGSPAVCHLTDGSLRMVYVERGGEGRGLKMVSSHDGLIWKAVDKTNEVLQRFAASEFVFSPSIHAPGEATDKLHLWYLVWSGEDGYNDLVHVESDDGIKWSEPVALPGKKIDPSGTIVSARVLRSGGLYYVCYLLRHEFRERNKPSRFTFVYRIRTSRDGKAWVNASLPEFNPPAKNQSETQCGPATAIFTARGVRLLFDQETVDGGRTIVGAFCSESRFRKDQP